MAKYTDEYFLMHKDIAVCMLEITSEGSIRNIRRNEAVSAHFPIGGQMNNIRFHEWWRDRAIPKTRHGAKTALQKLGYETTANALVNNLALGLSDCYWIKPRGEDLSWKDVNLFTNDFVDTFGEITLNPDHDIDLRSVTKFNCATSQGELQKKWCIDEDGRRYLIKGNYGDSYQQSLNEIFATKLHLLQEFDNYTSYSLVKVRTEGGIDALGCMCYDFCNEKIESISAWEMLQTIKTRQNESLYYPFKAVCVRFGMDEEYFDRFMDYQILTDFLISNTDRHMNNIAVLRNPDTLEIQGFSPIFDSGNSMFYNVPFEALERLRLNEIKTHSFVEREMRLLQYVKDRRAVELDRTDVDFAIYEKDIKERHIRIPELKKLYDKKRLYLEAFQKGKDIWKSR